MNNVRAGRYGMDLHHWKRIWWIVALAFDVWLLAWVALHLAGIRLPVEVSIAVAGAILGLAYFIQQQHLQNARFFKELATEFNRRYDTQNGKLLRHIEQDSGKPFTPEQTHDFIDYFNLCAEEWLFYKAGYIYDEVWRAWFNGMRQYGRDSRVARLWQQEQQTESYYGLDFPVNTDVIGP
jgi:hypothetical protein